MQIAGILHKPQFLFVFCNVSYLNLTPQGGPLSVINGVIVPINGLICNWGYFAFIISGVISPYLSLVFGPHLATKSQVDFVTCLTCIQTLD